ncbi:sensor domain-containing diguanylate cyclase [Xanthobacter sp. KR7-65]|uniref:sensor domain-containing diguanylate cyclase n=1 Tax=Xanthobacter sp. KR7-65 TaxID=3156612 RepID=UPI0032B429B5
MDASPDERFDRVTRLAARIYDADVAFIGLVDGQFQSLISLNTDALGRNVPRRDSVCNMIVESGQPMVVGDLKTDPRLAGHPLVPHLTLRFYAGAPLVAEPDLVLGTLCVMKREPGDQETFDLGPLLDLAAIAANEIAQWKLNLELKQISETDSLTGLPNRRIFDDAFERAIRRARRTAQTVSFLMIDIDHFKALNDLAGHQTGDKVLSQMGRLLSAMPRRPLDTLARIGGEEFALILPDTDGAGARIVAEGILEKLRQAAIIHPAGGLVSASIGGASQTGAAACASDLYFAADMALYEAKRGGRGRYSDKAG